MKVLLLNNKMEKMLMTMVKLLHKNKLNKKKVKKKRRMKKNRLGRVIVFYQRISHISSSWVLVTSSLSARVACLQMEYLGEMDSH